MAVRLVLGVDAHHRGWVALRLRDGAFDAALSGRALGPLLARAGEVAVVAVDMPVGLPERDVRACDRQARELLGPRHHSVFLTPPAAALAAPTHAEASAVSRRLTGRGISRQAYALRAKIEEVAALARADSRIVEVHPELSFRALRGESLPDAKTTWNGLARRRGLLAAAGIHIPELLPEAGDAPPPDVLDAAVAAWSADRLARGAAFSLPAGAARTDRQVIWC